MKRIPGLGPEGPSPGDAFKGIPTFLDTKGRSIGVKLPRPVEETPGPGDTAGSGDPFRTDLITMTSSPSWGELANRSSVRKPPWRTITQPPVFQLKNGEKLIMTNVPTQWKPGGPKYSIMPRRKEPRHPNVRGHDSELPAESEAMVALTSLG